MNLYKKIGVVVADRDEYLPLKQAAEKYSPEDISFMGREAMRFGFLGSEIVCVNCGIGKVNAAAISAALAADGCSLIFNYGLSGGMSGINRADVILPERFLEHDFDLTPLGYKPCEKPNQRYVYEASLVRETLKSVFPSALGGTAVCGDRFICSEADSAFFAKEYGATSCDMETAAIASVCDMAGVEFACLRRVSDGADESAIDSYTEMNTTEGGTLAELCLKALAAICGKEA